MPSGSSEGVEAGGRVGFLRLILDSVCNSFLGCFLKSKADDTAVIATASSEAPLSVVRVSSSDPLNVPPPAKVLTAAQRTRRNSKRQQSAVRKRRRVAEDKSRHRRGVRRAATCDASGSTLSWIGEWRAPTSSSCDSRDPMRRHDHSGFGAAPFPACRLVRGLFPSMR